MTYFDSLSRRVLLVAAAASLALAGCSGGGETATTTSGGADGQYTVADDYVLGDANAPVTIVEYASVACPGCALWHTTIYPDLRERYVDKGLAKYVFRPFPASTPEIATAGHRLALCADRNNFFKNIDLQFKRQAQIYDMARREQLQKAYFSLAKASGLSEDEFIACMSDPEVTRRYDAFTQMGIDDGVTGTPSIFVNGKKVSGTDLESIEDAMRPILGDKMPAKAESE